MGPHSRDPKCNQTAIKKRNKQIKQDFITSLKKWNWTKTEEEFLFWYENLIFQKTTNGGNLFAVTRQMIVSNHDGFVDWHR